MNSFTIIFEEKEEDFLIKPTKIDNNEKNSIIEINNNKDKKNKETFKRKDILESLKNNYLKLGSIPCKFDLVSGININTTFYIWKIDKTFN